MKEIADILMKQLRMIGELSRASFEHGDVHNLAELTEMQDKLGRDD